MSIRPVKKLIQAKPTLEGAGVHLRRALVSATRQTSIRSSCSMTFATTFLPMFLRGPVSFATHLGRWQSRPRESSG